MEKKTLTCIICPRGCTVTVCEDKVIGNGCPRGKVYAIQEMMNPVRTVTASVRIANRPDTMVPVKTATPIEKGKMFALMEQIHSAAAVAPIQIGDVILQNVCGTNVIATGNIL